MFSVPHHYIWLIILAMDAVELLLGLLLLFSVNHSIIVQVQHVEEILNRLGRNLCQVFALCGEPQPIAKRLQC